MSNLSFPELLAAVAGILLSLLFSYVPGLNTWYADKTDQVKKLIMLGLVIVVGASAYGLACAGLLAQLFSVELTCDQDGLLKLISAIIATLVANQAVYKLSPQLRNVKQAKEIVELEEKADLRPLDEQAVG